MYLLGSQCTKMIQLMNTFQGHKKSIENLMYYLQSKWYQLDIVHRRLYLIWHLTVQLEEHTYLHYKREFLNKMRLLNQ